MVDLIDTNIIVRFLVGDKNKKLFLQSKEIVEKIESGEKEVIILDVVIMECLFVLVKFYHLPKEEVIKDLEKILALPFVINNDKVIINEALNIFLSKNLDFVDSLIYAKAKFNRYGFLTLDKKLNRLDSKK